jgi:hypothetical protein
LRVADGTVSIEAIADSSMSRVLHRTELLTSLCAEPNLSLPRGALVQLMMGYAGWKELKALLPDVAVEPAVVPLVEVLFPKRSVYD